MTIFVLLIELDSVSCKIGYFIYKSCVQVLALIRVVT